MKLGQNYYLLQLGFIYPYLPPKHPFYIQLALLTYIYHYLPILGII